MAGDFKIIGFTSPSPMSSPEVEAEILTSYLSSYAVDHFHIRKPDTERSYVIKLMDSIPPVLHSRLVLHSHFTLFPNYNFIGMHFKSSNPIENGNYISASLHSLSELTLSKKKYSYVFLSPIFNSISKKGYLSKFSIKDDRFRKAIDGRNVVALGGVKPEYFKNLFDAKFAGAALLGYLWSPNSSHENKILNLIDCRKEIKTLFNKKC